jgi:hypothetical protein
MSRSSDAASVVRWIGLRTFWLLEGLDCWLHERGLHHTPVCWIVGRMEPWAYG